MIVYAESSAVLAWLLGQEGEQSVRGVFADAEAVIASDLTLVECQRVLIRAWTGGALSETGLADQQAALARVARHWVTLRLGEPVVERCRRPFPVEPVRTLDALHLAAALEARSSVPGLALLTLDQRIRENGARLGFSVVP